MEIIRRKFWESEENWENGKMSSLCSEGIDTQNEFLNPKHVSEAVPKIITNTHTLVAIHTSCVSCQFGAHKQNSAWKIQKYLRRNFKQLRSALQLLTRPAAVAVEKLQLLTAIFKDFQIPFTFQTHTQPHTHTRTLTLPGTPMCAAFENRSSARKRAQSLLYSSLLLSLFFGLNMKFPKLINKKE